MVPGTECPGSNQSPYGTAEQPDNQRVHQSSSEILTGSSRMVSVGSKVSHSGMRLAG